MERQALDGSSALRLLLAGNRRWAQGGEEVTLLSDPFVAPLAAVVCCVELGPAPERLFCRTAGSLFVLQGAGVCLDGSVVSGLAYAIATLGVRLVLLMGHTGCGLVEYPPAAGRQPARCVLELANELEHMPEFAELVAEHGVDLVPLVYDQESERVRLVC